MANQAAQVLMRKLVTGMQNKVSSPYGYRNNRGFTLIEILVVVVIMGITVGFALLAFGDFGRSRRIVMAAEQFINYVKLVEQQAILETSTLGIRLNKNSYQVVRFQFPSSWQIISKNVIFHQQQFPKNTVIRLTTENLQEEKGGPQIIIDASGDMTPFKLHVGSAKQTNIVTIVGEHNGNISLKLLKSP